MYQEYDLVQNNDKEEYAGSIFGFVTEDIDRLEQFLFLNNYDDFNVANYNGKRFGIIVDIHVEPEERNEGYGRSLIEQLLYIFQNEHNTDCVFLVCDGIADNDFNLLKWYESFGFEVISDKFDCPLMLLS